MTKKNEILKVARKANGKIYGKLEARQITRAKAEELWARVTHWARRQGA